MKLFMVPQLTKAKSLWNKGELYLDSITQFMMLDYLTVLRFVPETL